jgi:hypothetical protein
MAMIDFGNDGGEFYDINGDLVVWTDEKKWEWIRNWRNFWLAKSDWTQLPDNALSEDERAAWATYRQQLRDLPFDGDPEDAVPPQKPA